MTRLIQAENNWKDATQADEDGGRPKIFHLILIIVFIIIVEETIIETCQCKITKTTAMTPFLPTRESLSNSTKRSLAMATPTHLSRPELLDIAVIDYGWDQYEQGDTPAQCSRIIAQQNTHLDTAKAQLAHHFNWVSVELAIPEVDPCSWTTFGDL